MSHRLSPSVRTPAVLSAAEGLLEIVEAMIDTAETRETRQMWVSLP